MPEDTLTTLLNRIRNDFTYHEPDYTARLIHEDARRAFREFAYKLVTTFGPHNTREMSLAITELERCSFWVHANIARNKHAG